MLKPIKAAAGSTMASSSVSSVRVRSVRRHFLDISQPRQILHSPLHWHDYKGLPARVVKPPQMIVKSCKKRPPALARGKEIFPHLLVLVPPASLRCIHVKRIDINIGEGARSGAQPYNKRSRNRPEGEAMSNQSTSSSLSEPAPSSTEKINAGLGEIVVFIDARTETAGILEFAGVLAQEHGAHLTAVFMQPEPAVTPPETFARGKGMLSVIEVHRAQLEGIEADHRAQFENI